MLGVTSINPMPGLILSTSIAESSGLVYSLASDIHINKLVLPKHHVTLTRQDQDLRFYTAHGFLEVTTVRFLI
jgi:hypothetical protein